MRLSFKLFDALHALLLLMFTDASLLLFFCCWCFTAASHCCVFTSFYGCSSRSKRWA